MGEYLQREKRSPLVLGKMAVGEGFEPSKLAFTHFPGVLLRPLGHPTKDGR
jgi:hypothetical protein